MSTPHVIVEVWNPTNTSLVQTITVPGDTVEWHQVRGAKVAHERNRFVECKVTVDLDHPHADAFVKNRVVRVVEDGVPTAPWRIENRRPVRRSTRGHAGRVLEVNGTTLPGDFRGSVIAPARGPNRLPVSPDRLINFASLGLPTGAGTGWGTSYSQDSIWAGSEYPLPERWTSGFSNWIYSRPAAATHPGGTTWYRTPASGPDAFTLANPTNCIVVFSADDWCRVYANGTFLGETEDSKVDHWTSVENWRETFREPIRLDAGTHVFGFEVFNQQFSSISGTRAGLRFEIWSSNAGGGLGNLLYVSGTHVLAHDYATTPPGFEVGRIARTLLAESQARLTGGVGELAGWSTSFTNTHDSNGQPWPVVPEIVFRAGIDSFWTLMERLGLIWCDWETARSGLELHAFVKGTAPVSSGVEWDLDELAELSEDDGDLPVNSFWVQWEKGQTVVTDSASVSAFGVKRSEGIALSEASAAAAASVGTYKLAEKAWPVPAVLFDAPPVEGKRAWQDFSTRESVRISGEDYTVAGLTSGFGDEAGSRGGGRLITAVQLSTLRQERQYEQQRLIAAVEAGFDVGAASAPPLSRGFKSGAGKFSNIPIPSWSWGDSLADMYEEVDPDEDPEDIRVFQPFPASDPMRLWGWEINVSGEQEADGDTKVILMTSDGIAGAPFAMFILTLGPGDTHAEGRIFGAALLRRPKWVMPGLLRDGGHTNGSITVFATEDR